MNTDNQTKEFPLIHNYPLEPMSEEMSKAMLHATLDKSGDMSKQMLSELKKHRFYMMYDKFIEALDLKLDVQLKVFLFLVIADTSDYRPFGFDIYFSSMGQFAKDNEIAHWTMHDFARFLPNGYPSTQTMEKIWDDIKQYQYANKD